MATRFCYKDIAYPDYVYLGLFWYLYTKDNQFYFTPIHYVSESKEFICDVARQMMQNKENPKDIEVLKYGSLYKLKLSQKIPLKKEYWENPNLSLSDIDLTMAYLPAIDKTNLYQLLVVPAGYHKKKILLQSTIPFKKGFTEKEMETFMYNSDAAVMNSAKYAAMYDFTGVSYSIDWDTEIVTLPNDQDNGMQTIVDL